MVEVGSRTECEKLLKCTSFCGTPVSVETHKTLNRLKGVVKSRDLVGCSESEMVEELEGVVEARHVSVRRGDDTIQTNTWILTFDSPRPLTRIKVAYLDLPVRPYIPNPMRCFGCHRYGHTKMNCRRRPACPRCGKEDHQEGDCTSALRCLNCQGEHAANSKVGDRGHPDTRSGEHLVAVFFDLEKAFDTTWKHGILKDLHGLGMRGNLPLFVRAFLNNRSFQVKVGSTLSDPLDQEEGVPQGSILSPILFEIKLNSIVNELRQNVDGSLYVDDFLVCYRSKSSIDAIERQLQLQLNKLKEWADLNGFTFSPTKTVAVHFCRRRTCVREPDLYLNNQRVEVREQARFLGVIFDRKLNFLAHIKDLRTRCIKALRVLRVRMSAGNGVRIQHSPSCVPNPHSLEIGLRIVYIRLCETILSRHAGPDPSLGAALGTGGFLHLSCGESLRRGR